MGIKNLNTFLQKNASEGIKQRDISTLEGKSLAIDTSIFLYKFMYAGRFIDNFLSQVSHLRSFNIRPIYVFDGAPPKEKQEILNQRKEQKEKMYCKLEQLLENIKSKRKNGEDVKKLEKDYQAMKRKCISISRDDIINLKNVFDIFAVSYIQADSEADLLCCELYKTGVVDGCMSNDMDFLPSGCGILIHNYNLSNNITEYNLQRVLEILELSYEQFVDFCILCGCDYTRKIPRLGPITAFNLIKKEKDIETILEKYCGEGKKFKEPDNFDYQNSRLLLKNGNIQKPLTWEIKNEDNSVKKYSEMDSVQLSYIKSMTRFKDAKFDTIVQKLCLEN
jgi:flap endonuclease-1